MLRQQMCSLRSLQNKCIVFVPPGACRVGSVVRGGCFGLVFRKRLPGSLKWLWSCFGSPGLLEPPKEANRLSKPALKLLLPHVTQPLPEIISTVILLPSAESFKKGCCQLQAKVCARSTG